MRYQDVFKRYELKYLLTKEQKNIICGVMRPYMKEDVYGKSTIGNIYYDTDTHLLIRRSLEKPAYKEKLRVRSYGVPSPDGMVFVELKKKVDSIVYKRRIAMTEIDAAAFLQGQGPLVSSQIAREIDYTRRLYPRLGPALLLSYQREAFAGRDDPHFRLTFDNAILWRDYDLSLSAGFYGAPLLSPGQVLMEIKTAAAIPLWLTHLLSECRIYRTSFSKYGTAYQSMRGEQSAVERSIGYAG